jgi:hypothetical protein
MVKILKKIQPDTKGRIALGKYSKNVDLFSMEINEEGQIILTPHVAIPISNNWLDDTPKEKEKVLQGIKEAGENKVHDLGSFSKYI